ncbi:hypothetical protein BELL_0457g00020 [Botrytis elliptica]|uniref:Uncharacterized protein n=1 Tax=Botrytis elliptica TaxID=278938 RepID=A0A4Z1JF49_9HELO|nr:hypothetical protein BELL_0457g00020 [Botrytis elliptica]
MARVGIRIPRARGHKRSFYPPLLTSINHRNLFQPPTTAPSTRSRRFKTPTFEFSRPDIRIVGACEEAEYVLILLRRVKTKYCRSKGYSLGPRKSKRGHRLGVLDDLVGEIREKRLMFYNDEQEQDKIEQPLMPRNLIGVQKLKRRRIIAID